MIDTSHRLSTLFLKSNASGINLSQYLTGGRRSKKRER